LNTASQNIRYLRRKYQFTQEQMARKLGIKRSLLGAYEEARANPRLEVLVRAAELFNISVDQLVSDPLGKNSGDLSEAFAREDFHSGSQSENHLSKHMYEASEAVAMPLQSKSPYLPPRKINMSFSAAQKSLQRLRLVPEKEFKQYFFNAVEQDYLESLPELILPLPSAEEAQYRAFEVKDDAMQPISRGAIVVGQQVKNIQRLKDGKPHILITRLEGVLFRRLFNHIERSGNLLLEANHEAYEPIRLSVLGKEVEAWEVVLYLSAEEPSQSVSMEREQPMDLPKLTSIVMELQQEVLRLKDAMQHRH
jgi:transcriptional regulator with XRE-family HTH domain